MRVADLNPNWEENINRYKHLPQTYYKKIILSFESLKQERLGAVCDILKAILLQAKSSTLRVNWDTVDENDLLKILISWPNTEVIQFSELRESNLLTNLDIFTKTNFFNLRKIRWENEEKHSDSGQQVFRILELLSKNDSIKQNLEKLSVSEITGDDDLGLNIMKTKLLGYKKCVISTSYFIANQTIN